MPGEKARVFPMRPPLTGGSIAGLRAGDLVIISGIIYTARDAAHARLVELLDRGKPLPFDPVGQILYYAGPTPAPPGMPIGSVGPTTSYRMDLYTPALLKAGIKATIGKGPRSNAVVEAMKKCKAVYLAAVGGAGALLASHVSASSVIAFPELGAEAVRRLEVTAFPAVVINDVTGADLYDRSMRTWRKRLEREIKAGSHRSR